MESLSIENLRSLGSTGGVHLRPLTLLVGRNASGKSTFLRSLPLLRQSVETRTSVPILWFGPLVDFGNHQSALHRPVREDFIRFEFECRIPGAVRHAFTFSELKWRRFGRGTEPIHATVWLDVGPDPADSQSRVSIGMGCRTADHTVELRAGNDGNVISFQVNGRDLTTHTRTWKISDPEPFRLLPSILTLPRSSADEVERWVTRHIGLLRPFTDAITQYFRQEIHGNFGAKRARMIVSALEFGSSESLLASVKKGKNGTDSWLKKTREWSLTSPDFLRFRDLVVAETAVLLFGYVDSYVSESLLQLAYVAPIRAVAQRYYRRQGLAVERIDSQGTNTAMFLLNLTQAESNEFAVWCKGHFGFAVRGEADGDHVSLVLEDELDAIEEPQHVNLADTGFGYSQLLPIAVQLWTLLYRPAPHAFAGRRSAMIPTYFCIEQPELHLHPALQAVLVKALVSVVRDAQERGIDLRIVAETHSSTIVNGLGLQIAEKKIDPTDVNVVLFEKAAGRASTVREIAYGEDGVLKKWPIGFFAASGG